MSSSISNSQIQIIDHWQLIALGAKPVRDLRGSPRLPDSPRVEETRRTIPDPRRFGQQYGVDIFQGLRRVLNSDNSRKTMKTSEVRGISRSWRMKFSLTQSNFTL